MHSVKQELLALAIRQQREKLAQQSKSRPVTRNSLNISSGSRSEDDDSHLHGLALISSHNAHRHGEVNRGLHELLSFERELGATTNKGAVRKGSLIKTRLNGEVLWLFVLPVCVEDELHVKELDGEVTVVTELSPVIQAMRNNPRKKRIQINGSCEYEILEKH